MFPLNLKGHFSGQTLLILHSLYVVHRASLQCSKTSHHVSFFHQPLNNLMCSHAQVSPITHMEKRPNKPIGVRDLNCSVLWVDHFIFQNDHKKCTIFIQKELLIVEFQAHTRDISAVRFFLCVCSQRHFYYRCF